MTAPARSITGTVDVVPASRWVFVAAVSERLTRTPSVCPAANSPVTRPSSSAVAAVCRQHRSATANSPTARPHLLLSPFSRLSSFATRYTDRLLKQFQKQPTRFESFLPGQPRCADTSIIKKSVIQLLAPLNLSRCCLLFFLTKKLRRVP